MIIRPVSVGLIEIHDNESMILNSVDTRPLDKYEWDQEEPQNGADTVVVVKKENGVYKWKAVYQTDKYHFVCFSRHVTTNSRSTSTLITTTVNITAERQGNLFVLKVFMSMICKGLLQNDTKPMQFWT